MTRVELWQPVTLDDTYRCNRCDTAIGLVDIEAPTGGLQRWPAWRCRLTGELVCDDCKDGAW